MKTKFEWLFSYSEEILIEHSEKSKLKEQYCQKFCREYLKQQDHLFLIVLNDRERDSLTSRLKIKAGASIVRKIVDFDSELKNQIYNVMFATADEIGSIGCYYFFSSDKDVSVEEICQAIDSTKFARRRSGERFAKFIEQQPGSFFCRSHDSDSIVKITAV